MQHEALAVRAGPAVGRAGACTCPPHYPCPHAEKTITKYRAGAHAERWLQQRRQPRILFSTQSTRAAPPREERTPRAPGISTYITDAQRLRVNRAVCWIRADPFDVPRPEPPLSSIPRFAFFGAQSYERAVRLQLNATTPWKLTVHLHHHNITTHGALYWNLERPSSPPSSDSGAALSWGNPRASLHPIQCTPPSFSLPLSASLTPSYAKALGGLV